MTDQPTIEDLRALLRMWRTLRQLQALMRQRIDPEGSMTPEQFEDRALGEIDHEELNAALLQVEAYLSRATEEEAAKPSLH